MACDHKWTVTWYGPTGSNITEEKCTLCAAEKIGGLMSDQALALAALKANATLVHAANKPKS